QVSVASQLNGDVEESRGSEGDLADRSSDALDSLRCNLGYLKLAHGISAYLAEKRPIAPRLAVQANKAVAHRVDPVTEPISRVHISGRPVSGHPVPPYENIRVDPRGNDQCDLVHTRSKICVTCHPFLSDNPG